MKNVYQRAVDIDGLKDIPMCDYDAKQLVAYLTTAYPDDPKGALSYYRERLSVSPLVGETARILLEAM